MNPTNRRIRIVGAGLAGSLLAIYLARRGHRVTVFERRPDLRTNDISAGRSINLALANRGMAPLEEVGLGERARALLIPMRGRMIHEREGEPQFQRYGSRPHEAIYSISRGDLNRLLLDAAEATGRVDLRFSQRCTAVDFTAGEIHLVDESNGNLCKAPFDSLLGADGSASAVRDSIVAARGGETRIEPLAHGYKELTLPARAGGGFRIDQQSLHIWPREAFMLIALPNLGGSFTVTLFMPLEGEESSFAALADADAVSSFFARHFPDFVPHIPDLADQFFAHPTGRLATVRCNRWSLRERGLILGDAAHAVVPFHGQGMNAAFESCRELNRQLDRHGDDWAAAFAATEAARKPNADAIADMALENYVEMRSKVRDPRYLLKKALAFELERRFPERFVPRYSMVMFHTLPYARAKARGAVQERILDQLTTRKQRIEEIDFDRAARLIAAAPELAVTLAEERSGETAP